MNSSRLAKVSGADLYGYKASISLLASACTETETDVSWSVPDVSTKPDCRMRAITKLPQYFVPGVENLSITNGVELIGGVPGESLLFEGLAWVHFGGEEVAHGLRLCPPRCLSETGSASKSKHNSIYSTRSRRMRCKILALVLV